MPLRVATTIALLVSVGVVLTGAGSAPADVGFAPRTPLLADSFTREVSTGWGTAGMGGSYRAAAARAGSVHAGHGVLFLRPGVTAGQVARRVEVRNGQISTSIQLSKIPTRGAGITTSLDLRAHGKAAYRARTRISTGGRVFVSVYRVDKSGGLTRLGPTNVVMTGLAASETLHIDFMAAGATTVTLAARAWPEGSATPDWQLVSVDGSSSRLRGPSNPAIRASLSSGSDAVKVLFDDLQIWSVAADDVPVAPSPPVAPGAIGVGPTTTGPAPTTQLTVYQGDLTITTPGTVIDGLDVRGFVTIKAPNVTIKNSILRGRAGRRPVVDNLLGQPGLTIIDTEIFPAVPSPDVNGIMGYNFTLTRVNIHGALDAVHITGSNVTVEQSWLHDNLHYAQDPNWNGGPSHDDSIQIQQGSNIRVLSSNISGAHNAGIQVTQDRGSVSNLTVANSYMDGGGCTINIAEKSYGPVMGVTVSDTIFGRNTAVRDCAIISKPTTHVTVLRDFYNPDGTPIALRTY